MAKPETRARPLTVEDYHRLEDEGTIRHEYVAGQVHALAGVSARHNLIAMNIVAHLWAAARGGPCRVYASDVRLQVGDDAVYYPDVMVVCEPHDPGTRVIREPCLVVEVTSPSTAVVDRREKLAAYRRLPSLRAYLVVDQERRRVQRHWRDAEGAWWDADLEGDGRVPIPSPEVVLTTAEIYEGVEVGEGGSGEGE